MVYIALYRRWRPQFFAGLVGQPHVARVLANSVKRGSFVHAYLFCGPRGTGKTSAARILARAINCSQPTADGEPCGECPACRRALAGESMDLIEIDAASNRGIDEIRDLRERVKYAPAQEQYKVYIIDEVHMLTNDAFNALLKTLEEPPAHVVFILATTAPHKLPPTVLSRCQRFDFRRIGDDEIAAHLLEIARSENIPLLPDAAALIARKAEGCMRDAVSLLDQCSGAFAGVMGAEISACEVAALLGAVDRDFVLDWLHKLVAHDAAAALSAASQLSAAGKDLQQAVSDLLEATRDVLLMLLDSKNTFSDLPDWVRDYSPGTYLALLTAFSDLDSRLRYAVSPRITLELALIRACGVPPDASLPPATAPTTQKAETSDSFRLTQGKKAGPPKEAKTPKVKKDASTVAAVDISRVREKWPEIMNWIERKNAGAAAVLSSMRPDRIEGSMLYLDLPPSSGMFLPSVRNAGQYKTIIENAVNLTLRCSISIDAFIGEERPQQIDKTASSRVPVVTSDMPDINNEQTKLF